MTQMDVLVVESTAGAARREIAALEASGHRVHQCHDPGADSFPCRAIAEHCPIDGGIDVGLVIRPRVAPRPTDRELGVNCIVRAGIPLVEDGPSVLDPFQDHLTGRVTSGLVEACVQAAEVGREPLRQDILGRLGRLIAAAGVSPGEVDVRFERRGPDLRVELVGPEVPRPIQAAMAVRVLDAVRADRRTHGQVDVGYRSR
jgi:hypothetical protein